MVDPQIEHHRALRDALAIKKTAPLKRGPRGSGLDDLQAWQRYRSYQSVGLVRRRGHMFELVLATDNDLLRRGGQLHFV